MNQSNICRNDWFLKASLKNNASCGMKSATYHSDIFKTESYIVYINVIQNKKYKYKYKKDNGCLWGERKMMG